MEETMCPQQQGPDVFAKARVWHCDKIVTLTEVWSQIATDYKEFLASTGR